MRPGAWKSARYPRPFLSPWPLLLQVTAVVDLFLKNGPNEDGLPSLLLTGKGKLLQQSSELIVIINLEINVQLGMSTGSAVWWFSHRDKRSSSEKGTVAGFSWLDSQRQSRFQEDGANAPVALWPQAQPLEVRIINESWRPPFVMSGCSSLRNIYTKQWLLVIDLHMLNNLKMLLRV